jgi:hypothetical protein
MLDEKCLRKRGMLDQPISVITIVTMAQVRPSWLSRLEGIGGSWRGRVGRRSESPWKPGAPFPNWVVVAISHACSGCGLDLCRERSELEPRYRLRIVRCGACGTVGVRRPACTLGWRGRHRLRMMARAIGFNLLALVVLGGFAIGLCLGLAGERTGVPEAAAILGGLLAGQPVRDAGPGIILGALVVCGLAAGTWITAGLRHLPRWFAIALWAGLLQAGAAAPLLLDWAVDTMTQGRWPGTASQRAEVLEFGLRASGTAAVAAAVTVGGIPLGWGATRVFDSVSRAWGRRRRAGLRRRRRAE